MVTTLKRAWQRLTGVTPGKTQADLVAKYTHFQTLLSASNQVLTLMADREEKLSGDCLFDLQYLCVAMADCLTRLGQLTLYIKQLDISLVSDNMIDGYVEDFLGQS
jgi:hypothetical protein